MTARIGGGVLFKHQGGAFVKLDFNGEPAGRVNDSGHDDTGFRQNRIMPDGHGNGIGAQHRNGVGGADVVGIGLKMDTQSADFFRLFVSLTAAKERQNSCQRQISVESSRANFHSSSTKPQLANKVKTLMGKQHNKDEHKKRRKAYIKRKKAAVKTKKSAKAKA
jgi:hypothetical protein